MGNCTQLNQKKINQNIQNSQLNLGKLIVNENNQQQKNQIKQKETLSKRVKKAKYEKGERIGKSGKMFQAFSFDKGKVFAMKAISYQNLSSDELNARKKQLKKEIQLMKKLNHPRILKYFAFQYRKNQQQVELIFEFMEGGSLQNIMNKFQKQFDYRKIRNNIKQILEGLVFLQDQGISHNNLKLKNILEDCQGNVKISNFKKVIQYEQEKKKNNDKILEYINFNTAPEIISDLKFSSASDIWSVGCIVLHMITGQLVWYEKFQNQELQKLQDLKERTSEESHSEYNLLKEQIKNKLKDIIIQNDHPIYPLNLPYVVEKFLDQCFVKVPKQRATATQLLEDEFIQNELILQQILIQQQIGNYNKQNQNQELKDVLQVNSRKNNQDQILTFICGTGSLKFQQINSLTESQQDQMHEVHKYCQIIKQKNQV